MENNDFVKIFLDYYCKLDKPEFGVLLKGRWGCGKTHFILSYLNSRGSDRRNKFIYVSVNGLSSTDEIEAKMLASLYSVIDSKAGKALGYFLRQGSKYIKFDLPKIRFKEISRNIDQYIIVFDDLERCSLSTQELFGFINEYVEQLKCKVIMLADDSEIEDKENSSYLKIKEKVIGKELVIEPSFEESIDYFLTLLNNSIAKEQVESRVEDVRSIFEFSNYRNLRSVRYALLEFERAFSFLPNYYKTNKKFIDQFLSYSVCLSMEIRSGKLPLKKISMLNSVSFDSKRLQASTDDAELVEIVQKYPILKGSYMAAPHLELWESFFTMGGFNEGELIQSLQDSCFHQSLVESWEYLWDYRDLEEEEFKSHRKEVVSRLESNKIYHLAEFVQVASILLELSEKSLFDWSSSKIERKVVSSIRHNQEEGVLEGFEYIDNHFISRPSYKGRVCFSTNSTNLKSILGSIERMLEERSAILRKERIEELFQSLEMNPENFRSGISWEVDSKVRLYEYPILKEIAPEKFANVFLKIQNSKKKYVCWAFRDRYSSVSSFPLLAEEKVWLEEVKDIVSEKSSLLGVFTAVICEPLTDEIDTALANIASMAPKVHS